MLLYILRFSSFSLNSTVFTSIHFFVLFFHAVAFFSHAQSSLQESNTFCNTSVMKVMRFYESEIIACLPTCFVSKTFPVPLA